MGTLPEKIEVGQGLPVELTVRSLGPHREIDCGLEDPNKPGAFAQEPKKVTAQHDEARDAWSATLATEKLAPGAYKLLFRAENAVGETFSKPPLPLTVVQPVAAGTPGDKKAKKGRIAGVVAFKHDSKVKCAYGKVGLDGGEGKPTGRAVEIDDEGGFQFDHVPFGRHTLSATGGKGGVNGRGTLEVELDDSTGSQTILVE